MINMNMWQYLPPDLVNYVKSKLTSEEIHTLEDLFSKYRLFQNAPFEFDQEIIASDEGEMNRCTMSYQLNSLANQIAPTGKVLDAEKALDISLKITPGENAAYSSLAIIYYNTDRKALAKSAALKALKYLDVIDEKFNGIPREHWPDIHSDEQSDLFKKVMNKIINEDLKE